MLNTPNELCIQETVEVEKTNLESYNLLARASACAGVAFFSDGYKRVRG